MGATTNSEVARILLPQSRTLVDAAAFLQDADGEIIATDGIDPEKARAAVVSLGDEPASRDAAPNGALVTVPMRSGRLTVIADPLTPFFGHDEISRLEGLAALADLALARNELLDSQRRLAEIVESSDDAILAKSLDGTITSWNRGAERIYGYRTEEIMGKPVSLLVPPDIEDDVPAILEKVRRGEPIEHYETKRRSKDGRTIDVSLTISPMRDTSGRITGASTIARDVSINKAVERERESAREEANRANRAKNEFLSRMSHELRTPLNAVLGFAQLLEMDSLTPEQRDETAEIIKAGKHLLELVNEVLDISRIESGSLQLSLEPVDVVQAVEECISLLTPLSGDEGVTLSLQRRGVSDRSTYATADRQRLKQVLLNLIANGIKYNRQAGSVGVSFEHIGQARRLKIDVTDTGHGIRADRMDQLFAPFERLGAEGSGIEGTGLGLALSKPLVEAMGGTISVASELGKGTTFSVELASAEGPPMTREDEGATREEAGAVTATASRTILYVEDNLSNLKLVERLVTRRPDIVLISAMQGSMGVALARDHRPDLILLDLNLPDLPGAEVLARLHSDPRTVELPVVVISADATMGQMKRLLDAGARDYLTKPLDVNRFFEVLDAFCAEPRPA
jgi:PAS domain S-box-containing protein